ncbi:hypothetical protein BUALT_Bualt03G0222900 [Buddleja alternifolia]|uniref:Protein JASON n=1 Tax=Buddleja alternifolia TaxID=168488 RepID=A0AAV6XVV6_9LAMI|nr:hypothetical protein BUALT_Bualt03G0222900 [Buddleja alternifolia]
MVLYWFCSEKKEGEGLGVVGFMSRAMGWIFGCFRIKDSQSHLINPQESVASRSNKNALSSLFLSDDDSVRKGERIQNPPEGLDVRELKDEAKFLKACGTLPETPDEIRKASKKLVNISAQDREKKSLKFNSWLPNASAETLKREKQSDESPTAVKIGEELENTPSSCMTDGHNTRSNSFQSSDIQNVITHINVHASETHSANSSVSPGVFAPSVQCKNKSVRFDLESDGSAFSSKGSSSGSVVSKPSPYPTPLKLNDEMQTPGTVFPAYTNNMAGGKTNRIRSQYVYSVLNPVENPSQWVESKDENSDSNHQRESLNLNDEATLISTPISDNLSVGKEVENEASLSSWFKPASANKEGHNELFGSISGENVRCGRTPGDRPILGMVAAHWHDDETSHISPKWWDGNGIPNSTNKYKEDQKVSWHATPFEERLEKALSEETFISQRKPISGIPPIEYNESEESDTALSHLQSSAHSKSVVSF